MVRAAIEAGAGRLQGIDLATWSAGLHKVQSPESFLRLAKDTLSGGSSPFDNFSGVWAANEGKVRPRGLFINFDKGRGTVGGTISLPTKTQNISLSIDLKDHEDLPPAKLIYSGSMKDPQLIYDLRRPASGDAEAVRRLWCWPDQRKGSTARFARDP